jgi:hypothetical protein
MKERYTTSPSIPPPLRRGPLSPYLDGFAELMVEQGYSSPARWRKIRLAADLSSWLARRRLKVGVLDERQTAAFIEARWKRHPRQSGDQATLHHLLRHLRQLGVVPDPTAPCGAAAFIGRDYGHFLLHERGFAPVSVAQYVSRARRFLADRFPDERIKLPGLRAKDVIDLSDATRRSAGDDPFN